MTRGWRLAARTGIVAGLLVAVLGTACGDNSPTTPTASTTTLSPETFTGTLAASASGGSGGSSFRTFTVGSVGSVSVTLASLLKNGTPDNSSVSVGLGTPDSASNPTACTVTSSATIAPKLTAGFSADLASGASCVKIQDVNNLGPFDYAIRVVHP